MHHENILDRARTALAVIDMQEAFSSVISGFSETAAQIALVAHAVRLLEVPVIVTEQYPKGLGQTATEIRTVLPSDSHFIEKTSFSACGAPEFLSALERTDVRHVLLCGIEAHICVSQTAHDLLARGFQVHLLIDCIASRTAENRRFGIQKMRRAGALPSTTEMALFELMRDSRHKQFKNIQKLVK